MDRMSQAHDHRSGREARHYRPLAEKDFRGAGTVGTRQEGEGIDQLLEAVRALVLPFFRY